MATRHKDGLRSPALFYVVLAALTLGCEAKLSPNGGMQQSVGANASTAAGFVITSPSLKTNVKNAPVAWAQMAGAKSYDVVLATDDSFQQPVFTQLNATSGAVTLPTLADGTYWLLIRAKSNTIELASSVISFVLKTTAPGPFTISGPVGASNQATPQVAWTASNGATQYIVKLGSDALCATALATTPVAAPTLTWQTPSLPDGAYFACVTSTDDYGNQTVASSPAFSVKTTPPGEFQITGPASLVTSSPAQVTWVPSPSAKSYNVTVASDVACATTVAAGKTVTGTSWSAPTSLADGTYYVCATAIDAVGNSRPAANNGWKFVLHASPPGAFAIVTPAALSPATPVITWSASAQTPAPQYNLKVASDAACTTVLQNYPDLTLPYQPLATLTTGTYYLCLNAVDSYGHVTTASNSGLAFAVSIPLVQGQPDFYSDHDVSTGFNQPTYMAVMSGKVFVSDPQAGRVVTYLNLPTGPGTEADLAEGQADLYTTQAPSTINASTMSTPAGVAYDSNTRLLVSDPDRHRILIWNSLPTQSGQNASTVLGQANLNTGTLNTTSASTVQTPAGVWSTGTKIYAVDSGCHRMQLWTQYTTNNAVATVFGQSASSTTCGANSGGVSALSFSSPKDVSSDNTRLVVSDTGNNRVMLWNALPTVNTTAANVILGQSAITTNGSGATSQTLNAPGSAIIIGTKLIVADTGNNRVLIWNSIPGSTGVAADVVLGQASMTDHTAGTVGLSALNAPAAVRTDGTRLYVLDSGNNRVLVWNTVPTSSNTAASYLFGAGSIYAQGANEPWNGLLSAHNLHKPRALRSDGVHTLVADTGNNRVLIWNSLVNASNSSANLVLGQNSFVTNSPGTANTAMNGPDDVWSDGTRVYVADTNNNRVLVWASFPQSSGQPADFVIGQPDFLTVTGTTSAYGLMGPTSVMVKNNAVVVADTGNNRVMIWVNPIATDAQAADAVVGQADFVSAGAATTQGGLSGPRSAFYDGTNFFVSDTDNNRVLIWHSLPTGEGALANVVVGASDFVTVANGSPSATVMKQPYGLTSNGTELIVLDRGNNRVLCWHQLPTANLAAADTVLGQADFTSNAAVLSATGLAGGWQLFQDQYHLSIGASTQDRILEWVLP